MEDWEALAALAERLVLPLVDQVGLALAAVEDLAQLVDRLGQEALGALGQSGQPLVQEVAVAVAATAAQLTELAAMVVCAAEVVGAVELTVLLWLEQVLTARPAVFRSYL